MLLALIITVSFYPLRIRNFKWSEVSEATCRVLLSEWNCIKWAHKRLSTCLLFSLTVMKWNTESNCCNQYSIINFYTTQWNQIWIDCYLWSISGDPALLHDMISKEGVDISALDLMSAECVKDICEKCNIATSSKSLVIIHVAILVLIA